MSPELQRAHRLLVDEQLTLAIIKADQRWTSDRRGVLALLELVEDPEVNLAGASAADLVVGKAAALLYANAGISELWAGLLSDSAAEVLTHYGIAFEAAQRTEFIRDRSGAAMCPMERASQTVTDPEQAPAALRQAMAELRAARPQPA